jgi:hypothetical protein
MLMELGLSSRGASPGISISRLSAARHYRQEFFLLFAAGRALIAGISLTVHGTVLDRMWTLTPAATTRHRRTQSQTTGSEATRLGLAIGRGDSRDGSSRNVVDVFAERRFRER